MKTDRKTDHKTENSINQIFKVLTKLETIEVLKEPHLTVLVEEPTILGKNASFEISKSEARDLLEDFGLWDVEYYPESFTLKFK